MSDPTIADTPAASPPPPPPQPAPQSAPKAGGITPYYWVIFGAVFSMLAFGLLLAAFFFPNPSCDRWTLLRFVLPVFVGIATGAFVGAITAQGQVNSIVVAATGGFAVWLISLLVIGVPDRCKVISIAHFTDFDNTQKDGPPGNQLPIALKRQSGAYRFDSSSFVLFVGVVLGNIYVGPDGQIDLDVEVIGLDSDGKPAWTEPDHFDNINSWKQKGIPVRFSPGGVERALDIQDADKNGNYVIIWAIECFDPKALAKWDGHVAVKVSDRPTHRSQEALYDLSLGPKPPQFAAASCSECARNSSASGTFIK